MLLYTYTTLHREMLHFISFVADLYFTYLNLNETYKLKIILDPPGLTH